MKPITNKHPERTYAQRIQTKPSVRKALNIEQANRQSASGDRVPVKDILADWLEEKATTVLAEKAGA